MRITKRIFSSLVSVVLLSNCVTMISDARNDDVTYDVIADKISDDLVSAMEESSEDIPVTIWLKSIESPQLEMQIKNNIGYDVNEIESNYSAPSNELLNELAKASNGESSKYLRALMDNHLESTESSRRNEKEKTDLYLETKRELLSDYYSSQAESFLDDMDIPDDCVNFISEYTPMIICNISAEKVQSVAENGIVDAVSLHQNLVEELFAFNPADLPSYLNSLGITDIPSNLNLNGTGIKIGIFEAGVVDKNNCQNYGVNPSRVTIIDEQNSNSHYHPTIIAGIAAGSNGVAPSASIYSASTINTWVDSDQYDEVDHRYANLEAMISNGVSVFNFSFGGTVDIDSNPNTHNLYCEVSKYLDYVIEATGVTIVCADGNYSNNYVADVASSFNCISVNGYYIENSGNNQEEILNDFAYKTGNGCIKPDVISPSFDDGTSYSAPFICGIVALLYQYKPTLKAHPEAVKAILLASCHRKCDRVKSDSPPSYTDLSETMEAGLTDRQGAGIPNAYTMISIVAQHSYGFGKLNADNGYCREVHIFQPKYGATKMNVSMAYLHTNVPISQPDTCDDYDIQLDNPQYNVALLSENPTSSTEMIYANLTNNKRYTLRIQKNSGSMTNVKYGYAWSTNNASSFNNPDSFFQNPYMDGVYYIKNAKSGKYLTLNTSTNNAYQNNFTGNSNQLWIVDKSSTLVDNIKSASGNYKSLEIGDLISNSYYYATAKQTSSLIFLITNSNDGTFSLEKQNGMNWLRLGIYNNSTTNGASAAWYNYSDSNMAQRWYFEAVEFKKGDANNDGVLNQSDVTKITTMYSNPQNSYSNLERFLADYNCDGVINSSDASQLQGDI